jgi:hypothetical protein
MASDGNSGKIPNASPVHGSQATSLIRPHAGSGKPLPPTGKITAPRDGGTNPAAAAVTAGATATASAASTAAASAASTAKAAPQRSADPQALIDQLNKHLNDSGHPDQFRLDPGGTLIQQVNPATGEVIGEFAVSEFPALARSVGVSGALIDSHA